MLPQLPCQDAVSCFLLSFSCFVFLFRFPVSGFRSSFHVLRVHGQMMWRLLATPPPSPGKHRRTASGFFNEKPCLLSGATHMADGHELAASGARPLHEHTPVM